MALGTYSDLQTSVANWLHRTDLTALIPDFITMAEDRLSGDLDARPMDIVYQFTAATEYVATPTDMLEMRRMRLLTDPRAVLKYLTPDQMTERYSSATITGQPVAFSVIGTQFQFAPIPDSSYTVELIYRQKIPSLAANSTNWLMTNFPSAYLFGTLLMAAPYLINDDRIPTWERLYEEACNTINSIDWYSGSTMVMSTDVSLNGRGSGAYGA